MKKIIIVFICLFTITSCSTTYKKNETNKEIQNINNQLDYKYIFEYYDNKKGRTPIIQLSINNQQLSFYCDTGASKSWIYKSGVKKITTDFEEWEKNNIDVFFEDIVSTNPQNSYTYSEAKSIYRDMAKKGIAYTKIPITLYQDERKYDLVLSYSDTKHSYDGVLGLNFFEQLDFVSFDYIKKEIFFNKKLIDGDFVPLLLIEDERGKGCFIDCLINNEVERCLLDTGANVCVIRQDFQKDRNKIYDLIVSEKPKGNFKNIIKTLNVSNVEYKNIDFYYSVSTGLKCTDYVKEYLKGQTDIGFPVFENHIIQFDFENMRFYIL